MLESDTVSLCATRAFFVCSLHVAIRVDKGASNAQAYFQVVFSEEELFRKDLFIGK